MTAARRRLARARSAAQAIGTNRQSPQARAMTQKISAAVFSSAPRMVAVMPCLSKSERYGTRWSNELATLTCERHQIDPSFDRRFDKEATSKSVGLRSPTSAGRESGFAKRDSVNPTGNSGNGEEVRV